jgi:hypothetical protein
MKEANERYERERIKVIMDNVIKNLHKKDPTTLMLEEYEKSLHRADKVSETPNENTLSNLLKK